MVVVQEEEDTMMVEGRIKAHKSGGTAAKVERVMAMTNTILNNLEIMVVMTITMLVPMTITMVVGVVIMVEMEEEPTKCITAQEEV
jgi:hypothetical protein